MLTTNSLKDWLHNNLPRGDKLLLILATNENSMTVAQIKDASVTAGFREPHNKSWNISGILARTNGKAIRTNDGWELTKAGKMHLRNLGILSISPSAMQVAIDLRKILEKISDNQTRNFVEEAIKCHEAELYRSAIVMSWLGAIDVLQKHIHMHHLSAFNAEATRVNPKWRDAVSQDDLGKMREGEFLDRIATLSIIGKNVKAQLETCLTLRNGCGHPNSLQVSVNKSAAHIETLIQNVFEKFC